jgi:hypothetical protein
MSEILFKLCIYMILHDPILTFHKNDEKKLKYIFYNKNDLLVMEGFGNDQTPCLIIVFPPLLRKSFTYMGIKPAVYCIPKESITECMLQDCEKNKLSIKKEAKPNQLNPKNGENKNYGSNKNSDTKSNKYQAVNSENSQTGNCDENHGNNDKLNLSPKKMITKILNLNQKGQGVLKVTTPIKQASPNPSQNQSQINNQTIPVTPEKKKLFAPTNKDDKNAKKCYDHPLIIKKKAEEHSPIIKQPSTIKGSFTGSFVHTQMNLSKNEIDSNANGSFLTYKTNNYISKKTNSRTSSFGDCKDPSTGLNLQGINEEQFITKTSRGVKERDLLQKEFENLDGRKTISTAYTNITNNYAIKPALSPVSGFDMVRTKNSKTNFISDKIKRKFDVNKLNYPLKNNNGINEFLKLDSDRKAQEETRFIRNAQIEGFNHTNPKDIYQRYLPSESSTNEKLVQRRQERLNTNEDHNISAVSRKNEQEIFNRDPMNHFFNDMKFNAPKRENVQAVKKPQKESDSYSNENIPFNKNPQYKTYKEVMNPNNHSSSILNQINYLNNNTAGILSSKQTNTEMNRDSPKSSLVYVNDKLKQLNSNSFIKLKQGNLYFNSNTSHIKLKK